MADFIVLRISLTWAGVGQQEERNIFTAQGFAIIRDLEKLNTLSELLLTFKYISSAGVLT